MTSETMTKSHPHHYPLATLNIVVSGIVMTPQIPPTPPYDAYVKPITTSVLNSILSHIHFNVTTSYRHRDL
jgi:hypothetical protein